MEPDFELTHDQQRLLAGLFTRSHIKNRRRRYAAGYLMSELDGVTLNQSEIWLAYSGLERFGLIEAATAGKHLVMKLTATGDQFCRDFIFPDLFQSEAGEFPESETNPAPGSADLERYQGLSIQEIFDLIRNDPDLLESLKKTKLPNRNIEEKARDPVRSALTWVAREMDTYDLPNFEAAQAKSHLSIAIILTDAPSSPEIDIGKHITLACTIIGALTSAGGLLVATLTFLAAKG